MLSLLAFLLALGMGYLIGNIMATRPFPPPRPLIDLLEDARAEVLALWWERSVTEAQSSQPEPPSGPCYSRRS